MTGSRGRRWGCSIVTITTFLVPALLPQLSTAETVYRWTDQAGVVHFSEMPPRGESVPVDVLGERNRNRELPNPETPKEIRREEFRRPVAGSGNGLLWRVEADTPGKPSYLLGTIHIEDPRVLTLPPAAEAAFVGAEVFCMEIIPDLGAVNRISSAMVLTDGTDLKSVVGEPWYGRAVAALETHGLPEMVVARMKPWAVMALLGIPAARTGLFLDMMLYQRATIGGKEVVGLETPDEQAGAFDAISLADQVDLFRHTVEHLDEIPESIEALTKAYAAGDLEEIARLAEVSMADATASARSGVEHHLIRQRNRRMVQRLRPLLDRGSAFVAVGALHLPGDAGILQLLRDSGFRVRPGIFPDP